MALRSFTDSQGDGWRVWSVVPQYGPERDEDTLIPGMGAGWLCFENGGEKRRLTPIPKGWETSSEAELEEMCRTARPVSRRNAVE